MATSGSDLPLESSKDCCRILSQEYQCIFDMKRKCCSIKTTLLVQAKSPTDVFIVDLKSVHIESVLVKLGDTCVAGKWSISESGNSVEITINQVEKGTQFSVFLEYRTEEIGPSLLWRKDAGDNICAFTPGSLYNNRSMFLSHDRPDAEHTWRAEVVVPSQYTVLMSGALCNKEQCSSKLRYTFESTTQMPVSSLAIAVGKWDCLSVTNETVIYAPSSVLGTVKHSTIEYVRLCLKKCHELFGPMPFPRWDILIMPRSFGSLGLSNPYLAFLAPSVVLDMPLLSKIAHELVHVWFGCSVGLKDWNEDWFTEGIATFFEEHIHQLVTEHLLARGCQDLFDIRKYLILRRFFEEAKEEGCEAAQRLVVCEAQRSDEQALTSVANGLVRYKCFTQCHYVVGYLLFCKLARNFTLDFFSEVVKDFVLKYQDKQVMARDLFDLFESSVTMPPDFFVVDSPEKLLKEQECIVKRTTAYSEVVRVRNCLFGKLPGALNISHLTNEFDCAPLQYLLDLSLESGRKKCWKLSSLFASCRNCNAEIQHRLCELAIQYGLTEFADFIVRFLKLHQSLGVYLYGELAASSIESFRELRNLVISELREEYDPANYEMISQMVIS